MKSLLTQRLDNRLLAVGLAWLLCILTVAGYGGRWFWGLDLMVHFRVQYFWGLLVLILVLLTLRKWRVAEACAVCLVINALEIAPLWIHGRPHPGPEGTSLRLMLANVLTRNLDPKPLLGLIEREMPDVVVLEEIDVRWLRDLKAITDKYPYRKQIPRSDNFGIAVYSRHPLESVDVMVLGEAEVPSLLVRMEMGGWPVFILATHPLPPGGAEYSRLRNEQLAAIPDALDGLGGSRILIGDLNVTPWSPHFMRLRRETGLINSGIGVAWHTSWPARLPSLLRIPIDHCLHTPDLLVTSKRTGPYIGSDHLPLIVDFVIPGSVIIPTP